MNNDLDQNDRLGQELAALAREFDNSVKQDEDHAGTVSPRFQEPNGSGFHLSTTGAGLKTPRNPPHTPSGQPTIAQPTISASLNLTADDLRMFAALRIPCELLEEARICRVSDREARDEYAFHFKGRLDGILFPYHTPTGERVNARIRRDHPEIENGKPLAKYVAADRDHRRFYYPPRCRAFLTDPLTPIVIVEATKSVLAIQALSDRVNRKIFPIGVDGCWGWRGKIGKTIAPNGTRVDEKGSLPDFDHINWVDRRVIICFDSNVDRNTDVQAAERALVRELQKRGADVYCARIPHEPNINGPDDFIGSHCDEEFLQLLDDAAHDAWQDPQPIRDELPPVIKLGPNLIPEPFRDWLTDTAHRMRCPLDFLVAAAIVEISILIGTECGIRPKRHDDWLVVPNLWGGVVGPPSVMLKSPALSEVMKPLDRLEAEAREEFEKAMKAYEAEKEYFNAQREAAKAQMKAAAKGRKDGSERVIDAESAKQQYADLSEPPSPKRRRFKTNDTTIEKLSELLADNPRGILVFRDELIGFLSSFDRDGHESDRAFYLEAWNGTQSHETDRIGRGTIYTKRTCVSVLGGIQPAKLSTYLYAAMRGNDNDGFVQRLQVTVYPDPPEDISIVDKYPDKGARNRGHEIVHRLANMDFIQNGATASEEKDGICYFHFDEHAQRFFYEWFNDLCERIKHETEPIVAEHLGKYRSLMPSLALIFHLIEIADGQPGASISKETAARAAAFCEYLESHARRIYSLVTNITIRAASRLAGKIENGEVADPFTARDVYRPCWTLLDNKDVVENACAVLTSLGWLREDDLGRGRSQFWINPRVKTKTRKAHLTRTDTTDRPL